MEQKPSFGRPICGGCIRPRRSEDARVDRHVLRISAAGREGVTPPRKFRTRGYCVIIQQKGRDMTITLFFGRISAEAKAEVITGLSCRRDRERVGIKFMLIVHKSLLYMS